MRLQRAYNNLTLSVVQVLSFISVIFINKPPMLVRKTGQVITEVFIVANELLQEAVNV